MTLGKMIDADNNESATFLKLSGRHQDPNVD